MRCSLSTRVALSSSTSLHAGARASRRRPFAPARASPRFRRAARSRGPPPCASSVRTCVSVASSVSTFAPSASRAPPSAWARLAASELCADASDSQRAASACSEVTRDVSASRVGLEALLRRRVARCAQWPVRAASASERARSLASAADAASLPALDCCSCAASRLLGEGQLGNERFCSSALCSQRSRDSEASLAFVDSSSAMRIGARALARQSTSLACCIVCRALQLAARCATQAIASPPLELQLAVNEVCLQWQDFAVERRQLGCERVGARTFARQRRRRRVVAGARLLLLRCESRLWAAASSVASASARVRSVRSTTQWRRRRP
jgi:hypothetical protein